MLYVNLCWLVLIWSIIAIPIYLLVFNQSSQYLWLKWISFTLLSGLFATVYLIYTSAVYSPLYWHVVVAIDLFILVVYALGLIYAINQLIHFVTTK